MFYSWPITVAAGNLKAAPALINMPMSSGVIHQVDIMFPDTCNHTVNIQIFDADVQLWPSNRGGTVRGDAAVISFRDFYEMTASNNILKAAAWIEVGGVASTIWIHIGVLPRSILQPFSLAELLRAVQRA